VSVPGACLGIANPDFGHGHVTCFGIEYSDFGHESRPPHGVVRTISYDDDDLLTRIYFFNSLPNQHG
jgi:hypothetical protein